MPPTPPHRTTSKISPELVLVDRELLPIERRASVLPPLPELDGEIRDAMRRICELSDVNPPPRRGRQLLAYVGPAALWAEAALLVAAHIPFASV